MRYKGIIFDLDGTLLNTLSDIAVAGNTALRNNGFPVHPNETYRYLVGDGVKTLITRMLLEPARTEENIEMVRRDYKEYYVAHMLDLTEPYPGVRKTLEILRNAGIPLGVLSNKDDADTLTMTRHFFPETPFAAVFGFRGGVPKKPDPTGALEIAALMGLAPEEILFAGDTNVDIATGKAAGMGTAGVLWGFRDETELVFAGADHIVEHPMDLGELLSKEVLYGPEND